jgi:uncharacterized protein YyaL (SSP411 family)
MDRQPTRRSPADIRRDGNLLRAETSLYLQQHAHNPVDWRPWNAAALDLARSLDRPIFLSSGYASCHWCHVMEREVFEDDAIAARLNDAFVCIKVDREELPDVDATYMEAVQLLTGGGGWPMSVFLLPDGRPFFGGTYIPPDRFMALLDRIVELWATRRADLERQAEAVTERVAPELELSPADGAVDPGVADAAVRANAERFDHQHGGLAGPMKFPVPGRWQFLLDRWRATGDPSARAMVEQTLDAMAGGGLRDHVGGGFHRYTVDPHWTVPHFEKMLYDNAQLASLFLAAGAALDRPDYTAVGEDTLAFLDRDMCGDEGACYASLDADSGGEEGSYYVWTPAQVVAAVGAAEGPALAAALGVTEAGNFEDGASVATWRGEAARSPEAAALLERHRATLRAVRDGRVAPALDRKIVTAWNGLALSAFAQGFRATGQAAWRRRAAAMADYLLRVHVGCGGDLARASNGGAVTGEAVLADHALLARGLLDCFQATGEAHHLEAAGLLLGRMEALFAREGGGWYAGAAGQGAGLGRRVDVFDSVLPSGSSAAVDALMTWAVITGDAGALARADAALASHAGLLARAGLEMPGWLAAWGRRTGTVRVAVVAGDAGESRTEALYRAAAGPLSPWLAVVPVPADGAGEALVAVAPALAGKAAGGAGPRVFPCRMGACDAPVEDPEAIRALVSLEENAP